MKHAHWLVGVLTLFLVACGGQPPADGSGPGASSCRETLAGDITVPTSLRNVSGRTEACDYFIPNPGSSDHTVRVTAALDIGPGTVIRVADNVRIRVGSGGSINARGSGAEPVVLAGATAERGSWYGLCFADGYMDSSLDFVEIRWAGNLFTGAGSSVCNGAISGASDPRESGILNVTNSLIFGSYTSGISTFGLNLGNFSGNRLANNRLYGASVTTGNLGRLGHGDYLGTSVDAPNGEPYVLVYGTMNEAASTQTWRKLNAEYFVTREGNTGNVLLNDGVHVEIEPGVTFVMDAGTSFGIWDGAALTALGSADEPIVFRGSEETRGYWRGLYVTASGPITLEHVEVAWAGGSVDLAEGSISIHRSGATGDVALSDVLIRGSSTCAIFATGAGNQGVAIEGLVVEDHNDTFRQLCGPFEPAAG